MALFGSKTKMVDATEALPGRDTSMPVPERHLVLGTPLRPPFPDGFEMITCSGWAASGARSASSGRLDGVYTTAVGYAGGHTPNPTYEEVCSGRTGHTEAVLVVFDPSRDVVRAVLKIFWESHNPTQGMRQGNDVGTQYRSFIGWHSDAQRDAAPSVARHVPAGRSTDAGLGDITTEIVEAGPFYYAEPYHQQYLAANPHGYCGLGGTGLSCPVGVASAGNRASHVVIRADCAAAYRDLRVRVSELVRDRPDRGRSSGSRRPHPSGASATSSPTWSA